MSDHVLKIKENKLIKESIHTLFLRHRLSTFGVFVMTMILLFTYRDANEIQLLAWLGVVGFSAIAQWYCIHFYFLFPLRFDGYTWARLLALTSGVLGLSVGLSPCFFLDLNNATNVILVTLFLVAPIYGSTVFAAAYLPVHVVWTLGTTIPLVLSLISSQVTDLVVLGVAILLAGIPSGLILGWILSREFAMALRSRFENIQLIDELRYEKEKVEIISEDKSRFLAAVSHDLRQPLHALDLFHASLGLRIENQEQQDLLDLAQHSSHSLGEMLEELMDIARFDAGTIIPKHCLVSLPPLLHECAEEMTPLATEKGLELRVRLPRMAYANTDPILLKRIVRNFLFNAIRYTSQGGVLLGTRVRDAQFNIEVWDTGLGIGEEQLPHIFDEFYQINNLGRDREKGLGLGLAIVRRIADILGHPIDVHSFLGKGSCFSVAVPLCAARDSSSELWIEKDKSTQVDVSGMFVLVVDDDRTILQGMRELLRNWGCEVLLAENETVLLEELTAHEYPHPDALISDYRLRHGRTGLDVVRSVCGHFDRHIPSIIISGDVHPEVQAEVDKAGCRWLEKPVSDSVLKQVLVELSD